jgi:exosortase
LGTLPFFCSERRLRYNLSRGTSIMNMTTRIQVRGFALLCVLSILCWWRSLIMTLALALTNDAYTHILLILPLSAALIYTNAKYIDARALRTNPAPSPSLGSALLALALVLGSYARWGMGAEPSDVRLALSMFALVIWWIASVLVCFGAGTFRSFLFPLCFLFLAVPIPDFALGWIVEFLQHQSAFAAQIIFRVAGVPAVQDGIMLSIPGLDIEVARECSSIRSSLMLLITTMVLAHLFLHTWWRKALLIAASIPLSVAKNGLRIFTIAELGTRIDPGFLSGKLHHQGGIIFYGVAVIAMLALLWILRRTELQMPLQRPAPFLE